MVKWSAGCTKPSYDWSSCKSEFERALLNGGGLSLEIGKWDTCWAAEGRRLELLYFWRLFWWWTVAGCWLPAVLIKPFFVDAGDSEDAGGARWKFAFHDELVWNLVVGGGDRFELSVGLMLKLALFDSKYIVLEDLLLLTTEEGDEGEDEVGWKEVRWTMFCTFEKGGLDGGAIVPYAADEDTPQNKIVLASKNDKNKDNEEMLTRKCKWWRYCDGCGEENDADGMTECDSFNDIFAKNGSNEYDSVDGGRIKTIKFNSFSATFFLVLLVQSFDCWLLMAPVEGEYIECCLILTFLLAKSWANNN